MVPIFMTQSVLNLGFAVLAVLAFAPNSAYAKGPFCTALEASQEAKTDALKAYQQGLCALEENRFVDALDGFFEAEVLEAPVDDFLAFHTAQALLSLGKYDEARAALAGVTEDSHSQLQERALVRLAHISHLDDSPKKSREDHTKLLELFPEHPEVREFEYRLGVAEILDGVSRAGADRLYRLLIRYPGTNVALQAENQLNDLRSRGISPPQPSNAALLDHAAYLRSERRWADALGWIQHHLRDAIGTGKDGLAGELRSHLAATHFARESYDEALTLYRQSWEKSPTDGTGRQIARCLQRLGRLEEAKAAHWMRLEAGGRRNEILQDVSSMLWWEADYAGLLKLGDSDGIPNHEKLWREGWLRYRLGNTKSAIEVFRRFGALFPRNLAKATYWEARALLDGGRRNEGLGALERLVQRWPFGYYGIQASNRLYEAGRIPESFRTFPPAAWPEPNQKGARIHWWEGYEVLPHHGSASSWPVAAKAMLRLAPEPGQLRKQISKILFLQASGEKSEAIHALRHLVGSYLELERGVSVDLLLQRGPQLLFDNRPMARRTGLWGSKLPMNLPARDESRQRKRAYLAELKALSPKASKVLVQAHAALGEWQFVGQYGRLQTRAGTMPSSANREIYANIFPESYPDELATAYKTLGIHSDLIRALMHVESRLNPLAISRSDARGLMQVLPRTGRLIARAQGYREFGKDLLLHPQLAVYFGTWYLSQLIEKFRGQEVLAICSYNTGPFNVSYWLQRKPNVPFDVFLEEVPWKQPRAYVKKVLANLQIHSWLRTQSSALYISNTMEPKFGDNINF